MTDSPSTVTSSQLRRWLFTFALALVATDFVAGHVLARLYATVGSGQLAGMVNSTVAARADVLVLGASTARHHVDDRELTRRLGARVFNTGLDGRGIVFSRGLLALAHRAHPPKLVVLDVSYSDRDRTSARLLAPFYGRDPVVDEVLGWSWREKFKLLSLTYRFNGLVIPIFTNLNSPPVVSGYEALVGALPDTTLPRGPARSSDGFGPWYGQQLRKLVKEARAGGARIMFVESPTWGGTVAQVALDEYARVARELDVPYARLTPDREPQLAHARLYYDRVHLNREGAVVFTGLLEPILRRELAAADSTKR